MDYLSRSALALSNAFKNERLLRMFGDRDQT